MAMMLTINYNMLDKKLCLYIAIGSRHFYQDTDFSENFLVSKDKIANVVFA